MGILKYILSRTLFVRWHTIDTVPPQETNQTTKI